VRIAFDYVDPGSYLTHVLLDRWMRAREFSRIEWLPLEIRPPGKPLVDPRDPGWAGMTDTLHHEAVALEIPFTPPSFVPRTRKAMELALHAKEAGKGSHDPASGSETAFSALHEALFRAHFMEGRDLGRVDVLVAIAEETGLDGPECRTVLGVDRFKPVVESVRAELLEGGIRGVPTLIDGEIRLEGFQGAGELKIFLNEPGGHR
jgi:predicted DsbA family dithiol-disulfide isomerase